jgi:isoleucyl-tRNA synthetase
MVDIDRYALAQAQQLQQRLTGDLYPRYAFHHAVQEIVTYCSDDLGAFYLDILKDRLYTTAADSLARRSAQTALWHITRALLLWLQPMLCFTSDEAWAVFTGNADDSALFHTWHTLPDVAGQDALLARWDTLRTLRANVNKLIEDQRVANALGSSLQAEVSIVADAALYPLLTALGDDLKFVLIVSKVTLSAGEQTSITVTPASAHKCERCWHWRDDVGSHAEHPTLCGRCVSNLFGDGEARVHA